LLQQATNPSGQVVHVWPQLLPSSGPAGCWGGVICRDVAAESMRITVPIMVIYSIPIKPFLAILLIMVDVSYIFGTFWNGAAGGQTELLNGYIS
jgi:hypothetical protein